MLNLLFFSSTKKYSRLGILLAMCMLNGTIAHIKVKHNIAVVQYGVNLVNIQHSTAEK